MKINNWMADIVIDQGVMPWQLENVAEVRWVKAGGFVLTEDHWESGGYSQDYCKVQVGPEAAYLFEDPAFREIKFTETGMYAANHRVKIHPVFAGYHQQGMAEAVSIQILRKFWHPEVWALLRDVPVFYRHGVNPLPKVRELFKSRPLTVAYIEDTIGNPMLPADAGDWTLELKFDRIVAIRRFCSGGCGRQTITLSATIRDLCPEMDVSWWGYIVHGWRQCHLNDGCVQPATIPLSSDWWLVIHATAIDGAYLGYRKAIIAALANISSSTARDST